MAFPTDWNIDEYKTAHESEEQWQLRRSFMEKWKGNFSEDRLVCLARVFANIEYLGCRYPTEVMKLVAELSKEVALDYREKKKQKIQRTFVSASDAAGDRAKGIKRSASDITNPSIISGASPVVTTKLFVSAQSNVEEHENNQRPVFNVFDQPSFQQHKTSFSGGNRNTGQQFQRGNSTNFISAQSNNKEQNNLRPTFNVYGQPSFQHNKISTAGQQFQRANFGQNRNKKFKGDDSIITSIYGKLVLYDRPGSFVHKVVSSCMSCHVPVSTEFETKSSTEWICHFSVNGLTVSSGRGTSQKEAKEAAAVDTWKSLSESCYTLVEKQKHTTKDNTVISAQNVDIDKGHASLTDGLDNKVDSAIAKRMMKMMGWNGGALGTSGEGISEPIAPNLKQIRRTGLGSNNTGRSIRDALQRTINDFARTDCETDYDLVFASDFHKEERADMHKMAQRLGLKSKSYGKDDERYLVISKPISRSNLVKSLMDNGGSNEKYQLVVPKR